MADKKVKTNAMRLLDKAKIEYEPKYYDISEEEFSGEAVAMLLGLDVKSSFKTLVAKGEKMGYLVFVVPVDAQLDLKAAAKAAGDKRVAMIPLNDVLAVTGYIRGGVSPIGMKKAFPTYIDDSALNFEKISISAGMKGASVVVGAKTLVDFLRAKTASLSIQ